jgi:hypothetical protein
MELPGGEGRYPQWLPDLSSIRKISIGTNSADTATRRHGDTATRRHGDTATPATPAFLSSGDHPGFLKAEITGTTVVRSADNHMIVQRNLQDSRSLGHASG